MQHQKKAAHEAVTVAAIAVALGIIRRNVRRRAEKECWPFTEEAVRGGKRRLYAIADLPHDVQKALALHSVSTPSTQQPSAGIPSSLPADIRTASFSTDARAQELAATYERETDKRKAAARAALALVLECKALVGRGLSWRSVAPSLAAKHSVSTSTLSRAWKKIRGEPQHLWLYLLVPAAAGGAERLEITAEAWEILKADYLRLERPTASACIQRLRIAAKSRPDWMLPSSRTLERRLSKLPRAVKVLAREGRAAALDLYPSQQRSRAGIHALHTINGDGYKHNLWVRFPDNAVVRAKTWFWQDVYSSRILAWRTDQTEHTDIIRLSFGDVVERYGIPEAVLIDNTLAAANKAMSGGVRHRFRFKVREDEPLGVFALVGSRVMWATPGRGQSKPIERVFGVGGVGEYVDKAPDFAGAWTGANPFDRPDQDEYDGKAKAVDLADLERVIAREVAAWNAREGRRGSMNLDGKCCDGLFEESYKRSEALIRRATEWQCRLWLLSSEEVRAHAKDGSITLGAGRVAGERLANRYWAQPMIEFAGRYLVARFDPLRLHEGVHVYTAAGAHVCFAPCMEAAGFNDATKARELARDRNALVRKTREIHDLQVRMDGRQAAKALAGTDTPVIPAPSSSSPAHGKVVRGEFRDPLERPVPAAIAETPEEAAGLAALAEELRATNVAPLRDTEDEWAVHRRWRAIGRRISAGDEIDADARAWHASYGRSAECRTLEMMAADFPQALEERAAG